MRMRAGHGPVRVAAGGFMLLSGLSKHAVSAEEAARLHGVVAGAFPQLAPLEPESMVELLSRSEIVLGGALLAPLAPSRVVGAALTVFAAGLAAVYWKGPGLRQPGRVRPTEQGTAIAKDIWLTATTGTALVLDARRDRRRSGVTRI